MSRMFEHYQCQGKDKAPSFEPVVLEDAAADEEGNPLPRVVILPPTVSLSGDKMASRGNKKPDAADTPGQVSYVIKACKQINQNLSSLHSLLPSQEFTDSHRCEAWNIPTRALL